MRKILDIEASGLMGDNLDYSSMPFKIKEDFRVWCIVIRDLDTKAVFKFFGPSLTKENLKRALKGCTELIGHHIVGYDLPVLQLNNLLEYTIGYPGQPSTLFGEPIVITDTLILSKLLNADRYGGHSLDEWGKRVGNFKGKFNDWSKFSEEMLEYCVQDTSTTASVYDRLLFEMGEHDWSRPYSVELKLQDLTLKQEYFGFQFNKELAKANLEDLQEKMKAIALKVDHLLPPKRMPKSEYSEYIPPKVRFKKDGSVASHMQKFLDRTGAKLSEDNQKIIYKGKEFPVTTEEPLEMYTKADIEDIDVVKGYLISLGWEPTEVKERDLVKNQDKSVKTYQEIEAAIDRYVKQTETSVFKDLRLDMLGTTMKQLKNFLMLKIDGSKPIYVPSTPKLTIGLEKEICPNLIDLGEKAEFVKEVVHYYTYRHRKNSIAGGAVDEDGEPISGFLSYVREDGRIPTPADTLGANTGRYRHKIVCNIPRVTSLYGEQMRGMFGCGPGLWQLGYDFASLEARVMGHYVMPYTDGKALAEALVAEKPNDIHSINAKKLGIGRNEAKSFSYAAIYGAQPKKLAKMLGISESEAKKLYNDYWDAVPALKELKAKVELVWESSGKKTIPGLDGRLLMTRSKHSLINVLFQSGGAISAKWSAVRMAQAMEEAGVLGNPFVHSKEEPKVWWMIHMHDEQQLAVHPSLMHVQGFKTEEEALEAKNSTKGTSAIGHGSKGPYVGFETIPVQCIEKGIKSACEELKLRVDLGFEWSAGLNWAQTH